MLFARPSTQPRHHPCGSWRRGLSAVVLLLAICAAGACNPAAPVPLGQQFDLRVDASRTVAGGVKITFDRVNADSRCPIGVFCVVAGDASITLSVSRTGGDKADVQLHSPAQSEASYLSYSITLVELAPHPRADETINKKDYVATLTVVAK